MGDATLGASIAPFNPDFPDPPPGFEVCPEHTFRWLPTASRPGEAHLCPECAQSHRRASYARQKAGVA